MVWKQNVKLTIVNIDKQPINGRSVKRKETNKEHWVTIEKFLNYHQIYFHLDRKKYIPIDLFSSTYTKHQNAKKQRLDCIHLLSLIWFWLFSLVGAELAEFPTTNNYDN